MPLKDPVLAAFAIDTSANMSDRVDDIVGGHRTLLTALRKSQMCDMGVLYVYQTLFADSSVRTSRRGRGQRRQAQSYRHR